MHKDKEDNVESGAYVAKERQRTMNSEEIQVLVRSEKERENLLTPEFRCR